MDQEPSDAESSLANDENASKVRTLKGKPKTNEFTSLHWI